MTVTFTPEDYQPKVDEQLKKQQKKVSIKGFRPGKAPMGMVKKMYGESVLINEINELTNKTVNDYLKDNKIEILARPIESEDQKPLDFANPVDFSLSFDIGLAPEVNLNISDKDVVKRYKIQLPENELEDEIKFLTERFGDMKDKDVVEADDLIYAAINELDNDGKHLEGGLHHKHISFSLKNIEDEETKKLLIGKKKDEVFNIDLFKIYKDDKAMITRTLEVSEDIVNDMNPVVELEIHEIKSHQPAQVNKDLFDKVFPNSGITEETAFREKLKENMGEYYAEEAEQLFEHYLDKKLDENHPLPLPDSFLKRWLLESKEREYNESNIEERYAQEAFALRRMLVREKIAAENKIEISAEEIEDTAIAYSIGLFRQYGIPNATADMVKDYAMKQLKEYSFAQKMHDIAQRRKVTNKLKEIVTIQEEEIGKEDFYKKVNEQRGSETATA
ncbi:MAG: hypothetical protein J5I91_03970 [Bacteroidetes bacterium]|nr:hypothetical protein [Bacteroidota bacterium]